MFQPAKKALTSGLLLTHYNPRLDIVVSADASEKGLGGSIHHVMTDGSRRPIAFSSRALQKPEKNYSQIEKEGLAIITAIKKFHKFFFGRRFILETDHKPLLAIFGSKKGIPIHTANRLQRWAIILLSYNFEIKYISTDAFAYVDVLSRLINQHNKADIECVVATIKLESQLHSTIIHNLKCSKIDYEMLKKAYCQDTSMQRVMDLIRTKWETFKKKTIKH